MDRGQRVVLIKQLARRLNEESWADIGLTLRQFDIDTQGVTNWEDDYEFALLVLERARDDQLIELHHHLLPDEGSMDLSPVSAQSPWEAGMFRLFISHTTAHAERAGTLRRTLASWGIDAFVAHDTIEPTRAWQDVIESALLTCDALCALLTPDFVESRWCDQEVGFVVGRGVLVVPLKVGADPHGFIGKFQALPIPEGVHVSSVADRLFDALAKNRSTALAMAPAVVRRYEKSGSFDNTRAAFGLLQAIPRSAWTPTMMEQVERAATENSQVEHANLPGGRRVPEAAAEMLREIRGEPEPRGLTDEDIPF